MTTPGKTLEIRTSPHILSGYSVDTIMFNVVLALLPTTAFAVYVFGLAALATVVGLAQPRGNLLPAGFDGGAEAAFAADELKPVADLAY